MSSSVTLLGSRSCLSQLPLSIDGLRRSASLLSSPNIAHAIAILCREIGYPITPRRGGMRLRPRHPALAGRLGRAHSRPFLDLVLFAQKTVDFRLHDFNAFLLPL